MVLMATLTVIPVHLVTGLLVVGGAVIFGVFQLIEHWLTNGP